MSPTPRRRRDRSRAATAHRGHAQSPSSVHRRAFLGFDPQEATPLSCCHPNPDHPRLLEIETELLCQKATPSTGWLSL
jgi:hypothetical protein